MNPGELMMVPLDDAHGDASGAETTVRRSSTGWQHFPHDADIGVCGRGVSIEEAFEQAALALTAIVTDAPVRAEQRIEVECVRPDLELLFVDWLDAIIYEMSVRKMLFGRFSVRLGGLSLHGTLWGEAVDIARHAPVCEPKGATLTELKVALGPDGVWSARCIVDV